MTWQNGGISLSDAETLLQIHQAPASTSRTLQMPSQSPASQLPTVPQQQAQGPAFLLSPGSTQPSPNDIEAHPRINDDGMLHAGDGERQKFCGASSSQVFMKWLDSGSGGEKLAQHLKYGMSSSEEYQSPNLFKTQPELPSPPKVGVYLDKYFQLVHPSFPIVDEKRIRAMAAQPSMADPLSMTLLHLVTSHGADCCTPTAAFSSDGERYLDHAWMAMPSILAATFRTSVQILLLICLGLRNVCQHLQRYHLSLFVCSVTKMALLGRLPV